MPHPPVPTAQKLRRLKLLAFDRIASAIALDDVDADIRIRILGPRLGAPPPVGTIAHALYEREVALCRQLMVERHLAWVESLTVTQFAAVALELQQLGAQVSPTELARRLRSAIDASTSIATPIALATGRFAADALAISVSHIAQLLAGQRKEEAHERPRRRHARA